MKKTPWRHQHQGIGFAEFLEGCIENMGMGCGKTFTTLAIALKTQAKKNIITVCPKKVISVWPKEMTKYVNGDTHIVCYLDNENMSVAKKLKMLEKALLECEVNEKPLWLIINYDSVWREPIASAILKIEWGLMVLDEIHRIKSHDGKASKFCWKLGRASEKRLGLTGTLMPHSPLDVYAIFRAIDESIFGTSYTAFEKHFVTYGGFNGKEVTGYINVQELHDKIASITYRVSEDVLDLPETQDIVIECELCPGAKKVYKQLYDDLYAEVEAGEISVANALVKILRLQQLTGGFIPIDDEERHTQQNLFRIDRSKQEAVEELLEDIGKDEQIVVFYRFFGDGLAIEEACKKVKRTCGELSGKRNNLQEWQDRKFNVLRVQIQAGGEGIDLTNACYVLYYSVGHSLGQYLQSRKRAHRPGQTRKTFFYHITAKPTIDQKVYLALEKKQSVVDFVMVGIKENPFGHKLCSPGKPLQLQEAIWE